MIEMWSGRVVIFSTPENQKQMSAIITCNLVQRTWKDDWTKFEPVLILLADSTARAAEISVNMSVRYVTSVGISKQYVHQSDIIHDIQVQYVY